MKTAAMTLSRTPLALALAALALGAVSGCSTLSSGMGGGDLTAQGRPATPVMFSWQSQDGGISGSMAATLPDATYQGQFMQITQQTRGESMAPMWIGWNQGWDDWPFGSQPWAGLTAIDTISTSGRQYTGQVIANLRNAGGQYMRCRFHMNEPAAGMAGGGQGECQLSGGRRVEAVINGQD